MHVLFIAPGYPDEMPFFVRGLAQHGARVYGISDVPEASLPAHCRRYLSGYLQVSSLVHEAQVVQEVRQWVGGRTIDRVCCMWEPGIVLAARLREALGVPGQDVTQANAFRDKDVMKQWVQAAGIRCATHRRAATEREVREAAEAIGFPVIVKPIAGAGSMDTFKADDAAQLDRALARLHHVPIVNVEEFIDYADEFTFDTICSGGEIKYLNIGYYRPVPLVARSNEWISPQTICLRDIDDPWLAGGRALGPAVIRAMGFQTGFTHMEWFITKKGEAVFSEIAARPPGARTVDLMNFAADVDLFTGWAEVELTGTFSLTVDRKYNTANIFKRAVGQGRIARIDGLGSLLHRYGEHIVNVDLLPVGAPRRDWILTLVSDGYVTIRHPDFRAMCEIADAVGTDLTLYAE